MEASFFVAVAREGNEEGHRSAEEVRRSRKDEGHGVAAQVEAFDDCGKEVVEA